MDRDNSEGASSVSRNEREMSADYSEDSSEHHFQRRYFRLFLNIFQLIGLNLELKPRGKCLLILKWLVLSIVLLMTSVGICLQIYSFRKIKKIENSIWNIGFTEHYVVVSVIIIVMLRERHINKLFIDCLRHLSQFSHKSRSTSKSIKKMAIFCFFIGFFDFCLESYYFIKYVFIPPTNYTFLDMDYYYGIKIADQTLNEILVNLDYFSYVVEILCSDLFCAFLIFLLFLTTKCYQQLNKHFKNNKQVSSKAFIADHLSLAALVQRLNDILSPAILIVVATHMFSLVATAHEITIIFKNNESVEYKMERIVQFVKFVVQFVLLTHFGYQIQSQSQEAIALLLQTTISNEKNDDYNDNHQQILNSILDGKLTNLFTSQMLSSPVALRGSKFFVIDYNLITIVVSIAITYSTIISSFDVKKDPESPGMNKCCTNFTTYFNETIL